MGCVLFVRDPGVQCGTYGTCTVQDTTYCTYSTVTRYVAGCPKVTAKKRSSAAIPQDPDLASYSGSVIHSS